MSSPRSKCINLRICYQMLALQGLHLKEKHNSILWCRLGSLFGRRRLKQETVAVEMWNTLGCSATGHHEQVRATPMSLIPPIHHVSFLCGRAYWRPIDPDLTKTMFVPNTLQTTEELISPLISSLICSIRSIESSQLKRHTNAFANMEVTK